MGVVHPLADVDGVSLVRAFGTGTKCQPVVPFLDGLGYGQIAVGGQLGDDLVGYGVIECGTFKLGDIEAVADGRGLVLVFDPEVRPLGGFILTLVLYVPVLGIGGFVDSHGFSV